MTQKMSGKEKMIGITVVAIIATLGTLGVLSALSIPANAQECESTDDKLECGVVEFKDDKIEFGQELEFKDDKIEGGQCELKDGVLECVEEEEGHKK
jgi:hypothetical protein